MLDTQPTHDQQLLIDHRIACYEAGYPICDACYSSIDEYERVTGKKYPAYGVHTSAINED